MTGLSYYCYVRRATEFGKKFQMTVTLFLEIFLKHSVG